VFSSIVVICIEEPVGILAPWVVAAHALLRNQVLVGESYHPRHMISLCGDRKTRVVLPGKITKIGCLST
jgi:hypothetical protein